LFDEMIRCDSNVKRRFGSAAAGGCKRFAAILVPHYG
jgi:hypothetical protein